MQTTKQIEVDGQGKHIKHNGVKYRPFSLATVLSEGKASVNFPRPSTSDDSYATVTQGELSEAWKPAGV
ncbi:hypothetical protein [Myxococcus eversor]|uniref:hypothetical protein n=1 Tax=Myxococcus eversor TaxID=2709661 RepID=UPI0013D24319|nr:hypothetical protein [Myxococcus eversor]